MHLIRWSLGLLPAGGTSVAETPGCFKPLEVDRNWRSACIAEPWAQAGMQTFFKASLHVTFQLPQPLDAVLTPWSFCPSLPLGLTRVGWVRILWKASPQWLRLGEWGDNGGTLQGHQQPLDVGWGRCWGAETNRARCLGGTDVAASLGEDLAGEDKSEESI